jgi:hypothetical protein
MLAQSPYIRSLTTLRLELNHITERGAQALANSQHLHEDLRAQWRSLLAD